MKRQIRKWLMGDTVFSAYSKITVPDDIPEKVYLEIAGRIIDISKSHWILCIEPIIFGLWIEKEDYVTPKKNAKYYMYFSDSVNSDNKSITRKREATLTLNFFDCIEEKNGTLLLLKLEKSKIHHLNLIKTYLLFFRYYKKSGLSFARFKSFVAAYSYPRRIRLISFRQDNYYNIFPMDLLGDIRQHHRYVFGLRHTNTALPRIIETGKLVVSEVSFKYKDIIYQLGKHHSGNPPSLDSLPFDVVLSKNFEFYVPALAETYKEIKILRTMNLGSHMLLWGELIEEDILTDPGNHLFIVHFLHYLYQKNQGVNYKLA
jgi:hypothetical protein